MSWKDYQKGLRQPAHRRLRFRRIVLLVIGAFSLVSIWSRVSTKFERLAGRSHSEAQERNPIETNRMEKVKFQRYISPQVLTEASKDVEYEVDGKRHIAELTLDADLQRYATKILQKNKVDWGAFAAVDAATGRVLALAYHSQVDSTVDNLALRATFPAASVFKVVTAAAGLEEGLFRTDSIFRYSGDVYGIGSRQVLKDGGYNSMALDTAFAKSANLVFGKMGAFKVGGARLEEYAGKFGFGDTIPFELPLQPSVMHLAQRDDQMDVAETAAGFGAVTLSPLHGALIAASVLNDGQMMEPYFVERAFGPEGELEYEMKPRLWKSVLSPITAREVRKMMTKTFTVGTSRKFFRGVSRDKVLSKLMMGGKTGSLDGTNPKGRTEWLVAYARSQYRQIAVASVMVSEKYWRIKPSQMVHDIFDFYFSPRPVLEASAGQKSHNAQ